MFGFNENKKEDLETVISPTEWLDEILKEAVREKASDVHIVPYSDRMVVNFRVDGAMRNIDEWDIEYHEKVMSRIKVVAGLDVVEKQMPQDGHMEIMLNWLGSPKKQEEEDQSDEEEDADELKNENTSTSGTSADTEDTETSSKADSDTAAKESKTQREKKAQEHEETDEKNNSRKRILANFRVSMMPTIHGEVAVLRALNRVDSLMRVEELGLSEKVFPLMLGMIRKSHGMVLLTGPTGSGKTTTLYSILNRIREKEKTILTLEDPVEYKLNGVRQTQIRPNDADGITWSAGLKATLRQDPDTLMVGEIRDEETAEIAIHAALAGRQVFSTFHTNSVEGVLLQLMSMNIARSPIASAITGIITQRLVRKICPDCRIKGRPPAELLKILEIDSWNWGDVYAGEGCRNCDGTGYQGRIGIFEVLAIDEELRMLILQQQAFRKVEDVTRNKIKESLKEDGLAKVRSGITTLEEVVRAVV